MFNDVFKNKRRHGVLFQDKEGKKINMRQFISQTLIKANGIKIAVINS
jgi:hypothetical protein